MRVSFRGGPFDGEEYDCEAANARRAGSSEVYYPNAYPDEEGHLVIEYLHASLVEEPREPWLGVSEGSPPTP